MNASELLLVARRRSGLGLRETARRAGTSHATLAAYESGAKEPGVATLDRILLAAGLEADVRLVRRPDGTRAEREAKGRELVEVLDLAAVFPARHDRRLAAPVFRRLP